MLKRSRLLAAAVGLGLAVHGTAGPLSERLLVTARSGALSKLFLVRLDGRDWQRLTDRRGSEADGAYSPVRNEVYFRALERSDWEIFAWSVEDRSTRRLTHASGMDHQPQPSPDGHWLAYTTQRFGVDELMLQSLERPDEEPRRLTWDQAQNFSPCWAPDGKRLVFCSRRNGQADLYVRDLDRDSVTRLTATDEDEVDPRWSPDGTKILFQTTEGRHRRGVLGWLEMPGRQRVELAELEGSLHQASWSPDGSSIVCLNYGSPTQPVSPQLTVFSTRDRQPETVLPYQRVALPVAWSYRQVSWPLAAPSVWPEVRR